MMKGEEIDVFPFLSSPQKQYTVQRGHPTLRLQAVGGRFSAATRHFEKCFPENLVTSVTEFNFSVYTITIPVV